MRIAFPRLGDVYSCDRNDRVFSPCSGVEAWLCVAVSASWSMIRELTVDCCASYAASGSIDDTSISRSSSTRQRRPTLSLCCCSAYGPTVST